MDHYQAVLLVPTVGKNFYDLTSRIKEKVRNSGIITGLCTVFVRHTSASLVIQENADPDVLHDLSSFFSQLVPEDRLRYRHGTEGVDDMPAHIRSALTNTSEQIPITDGRLALGTWQGIYLWEHRQLNHNREVIVHINGTTH